MQGLMVVGFIVEEILSNLWKRCIRKTVNQRGLIGKM